ncbi:MAG: NusG domain II-containing protein [Ruminococcaceae bacterium]|nr:NusG domain II-containing protein [Oscillospiraceae bacterium]
MDLTKETPKPEEKKKRKLRNDLILIGVLLVVLVLVGLAFWLFRGTGDTVIVEVDGKVFGTYSLSKNQTVEIHTGEGGKELNLLVIKDGRAFVETATCRDGICAAHAPISREGESIVCLPHKVVITVKRSENKVSEENVPDIIT